VTAASNVEETIWPEATERLSRDPAFGPLVEKVGPVRLRPPRGDPFASLVAAITYQQLAGAAALTIHGRLVDALDHDVRPATVLAAEDHALRGAGLSAAKLAAIRDLAEKVSTGTVQLGGFDGASDTEIRDRLTRVRGIGPWTAQMFLMFDLRRPDIWPVGDLGVRNGLGRILDLPDPPTPAEAELIGTGYRPWRSAVAWYCWRAVETLTPDQ
jgi:DNA-3-methyladenine glycosylase II